MNLIRFARALLATNLKSAAALRGAFALQVVFMILNNATFFVFWWVLFEKVPDLGGWQLPEVQLLFGISAASFGLTVTVAGGVRHLGRFIDEGALDPLIAQPKPTLLYALGMRSQPSGMGDFLSGVAFLVLSGHVTWANLPLALLSILAGSVIYLSAGVVFFSLAFWLNRTESLARQLWELLITFSLYPEPLFGGGLRLLLFTVLPAAFISYLPVRIVTSPTFLDIGLLITATLGYLLFAVWFFKRGLRRYSSGSRFGVLG
jgi:ABC-2 type transport system permease protein